MRFEEENNGVSIRVRASNIVLCSERLILIWQPKALAVARTGYRSSGYLPRCIRFLFVFVIPIYCWCWYLIFFSWEIRSLLHIILKCPSWMSKINFLEPVTNTSNNITIKLGSKEKIEFCLIFKNTRVSFNISKYLWSRSSYLLHTYICSPHNNCISFRIELFPSVPNEIHLKASISISTPTPPTPQQQAKQSSNQIFSLFFLSDRSLSRSTSTQTHTHSNFKCSHVRLS